jgi:uncharacterized membrane protein
VAKYFSFKPGLTLKGRKFKGLRGFAGKPFHPPMTDVTVGAYTIGPIFDIVALLFKDSSWADDLFKAGGWVILAGAISSLVTILTGFMDWLRSTPKGTQARRMVNAHAWTMVALTVVVLINLWYRYLSEGGEYYAEPNGVTAVLSLVVLGLVTIGGTLGGDLVFDWGFNVEVAKDHPVWAPSDENLYVSPHQAEPGDTEVT